MLVACRKAWALGSERGVEAAKGILKRCVGVWTAQFPKFWFQLVLQLMAVEVMWTPEAENDFYTRDEMFQDYPTLNTL
jgi:Protein of unknown function (DUF1517)